MSALLCWGVLATYFVATRPTRGTWLTDVTPCFWKSPQLTWQAFLESETKGVSRYFLQFFQFPRAPKPQLGFKNSVKFCLFSLLWTLLGWMSCICGLYIACTFCFWVACCWNNLLQGLMKVCSSIAHFTWWMVWLSLTQQIIRMFEGK